MFLLGREDSDFLFVKFLDEPPPNVFGVVKSPSGAFAYAVAEPEVLFPHPVSRPDEALLAALEKFVGKTPIVNPVQWLRKEVPLFLF